MKHKPIAAIILGAGKGTRMKSDLPKVMMPVANKPMIKHIIDTLEEMEVAQIVTIISDDGELVKQTVKPYEVAVQKEQLGTGHAVKCAKEVMKPFDGTLRNENSPLGSKYKSNALSHHYKTGNSPLPPSHRVCSLLNSTNCQLS